MKFFNKEGIVLKLKFFTKKELSEDDEIKKFIKDYSRDMEKVEREHVGEFRGCWYPLKEKDYEKYKKWEDKINEMSKIYFFKFFPNEFYVTKKWAKNNQSKGNRIISIALFLTKYLKTKYHR